MIEWIAGGVVAALGAIGALLWKVYRSVRDQGRAEGELARAERERAQRASQVADQRRIEHAAERRKAADRAVHPPIPAPTESDADALADEADRERRDRYERKP